jgi:hypothetical protein
VISTPRHSPSATTPFWLSKTRTAASAVSCSRIYQSTALSALSIPCYQSTHFFSRVCHVRVTSPSHAMNRLPHPLTCRFPHHQSPPPKCANVHPMYEFPQSPLPSRLSFCTSLLNYSIVHRTLTFTVLRPTNLSPNTRMSPPLYESTRHPCWMHDAPSSFPWSPRSLVSGADLTSGPHLSALSSLY